MYSASVSKSSCHIQHSPQNTYKRREREQEIKKNAKDTISPLKNHFRNCIIFPFAFRIWPKHIWLVKRRLTRVFWKQFGCEIVKAMCRSKPHGILLRIPYKIIVRYIKKKRRNVKWERFNLQWETEYGFSFFL